MRSTLAAFLLVMITVSGAHAAVQTFTVVAGKGQEVVFASKAPMETFEGRTDQASGTITADLANLADSCQVRIAVDLASLETGIGMRDNHMRERHLETDKYPSAIFTGAQVVSAEPRSLAPGGRAQVTLAGRFDLHGVGRDLQVAVDLALAADGVLTVRAAFPVLLSDHAIDRPQVLVLKLADEQKVRIALTARPATLEAGP